MDLFFNNISCRINRRDIDGIHLSKKPVKCLWTEQTQRIEPNNTNVRLDGLYHYHSKLYNTATGTTTWGTGCSGKQDTKEKTDPEVLTLSVGQSGGADVTNQNTLTKVGLFPSLYSAETPKAAVALPATTKPIKHVVGDSLAYTSSFACLDCSCLAVVNSSSSPALVFVINSSLNKLFTVSSFGALLLGSSTKIAIPSQEATVVSPSGESFPNPSTLVSASLDKASESETRQSSNSITGKNTGASTVVANPLGAERSSVEVSNDHTKAETMAEAMLDAEQLNAKITEICLSLSTLTTRERDLQNANNEVDLIEKDVILRRLRAERRTLNKELAEYTVRKALVEYNATADEDEGDDEQEPDAGGEEDQALDNLELDEDNAEEYTRLMNLLTRTKVDIKSRKINIEKLLNNNTSFLSESEKRLSDVKVKSSIKTIGEQVTLYKNYSRDLLKICSHERIDELQRDLGEVMDTSNEITCLFEAMKERERRIENASNAPNLKNLSIAKYEAVGVDKFLKYTSFIEEFTEFILSRPLSPLVKLNYLKSCLLGEAYDLVKSYTMGSQLNEALSVLEEHYQKPDFVIAEVYRNLKSIPSINNFKDIKAAKDQVHTIKTSIATLKSLIYEAELVKETNLQNTFLLVDLESKIPLDCYTDWVGNKNKLKLAGKQANLEDFATFYEKTVDLQNDALYLRKQIETINRQTPDDPSNRKKRGGNKKGKPANDSANLLATQVSENDANDGATQPDQKGPFKNAFCIFENVNGHDTAFCKNMKLDTDYKMSTAKKHKVCLVCLKVASHKPEDCNFKYKDCVVCKKMHNGNLHTRKEYLNALKKKKNKEKKEID